jgi:hypothetical protein
MSCSAAPTTGWWTTAARAAGVLGVQRGQFNIGLTDQDPCGLNGWPTDLVSGGVPESTNRITLGDLTKLPGADTIPGQESGAPGLRLGGTWYRA